jgi:hypothetical protein
MYWHLTAVTTWQSPCSTIVLGKFFPGRLWIGLRFLSLFLSSPFCPCLSYLSSVFYFPTCFQLILPILILSLVPFFVFCVYFLICLCFVKFIYSHQAMHANTNIEHGSPTDRFIQNLRDDPATSYIALYQDSIQSSQRMQVFYLLFLKSEALLCLFPTS